MQKILFATSEAYPLVKTGGLADVSGSLPIALQSLGVDVRLVLPAYRQVLSGAGRLTPVAWLEDTLAGVTVRILEGILPGSDVCAWFVDAPEYYDRPGGLYVDEHGRDWPDNALRFTLFARTIVALAQGYPGLSWKPDIVHCHDWQTGLVPALLALGPGHVPSVFTIHNLAYQGLFPAQTFIDLGLPQELWSMHALEFHDKLSFIKGGLVFADWLTTVSPTYAKEIRSAEFGCGLEAVLRLEADHLVGILNGVDYSEWSPEHDPHIARTYSIRNLDDKQTNKTALMQRFALDGPENVPIIGMVTRLAGQKGIDLVLDVLPDLFRHKLRLVVLGSGDGDYEARLRKAAKRYSGRMGVHIGYDEALAHQVEAGADMFLMPSRYEPCGLNQIYSLRYGTLPVVRRTGGLADTVTNLSPAQKHIATGFTFDEAEPEALLGALKRALQTYRKPAQWRSLQVRAMMQDYSWQNSAAHYVDLYQRAAGGVRRAP